MAIKLYEDLSEEIKRLGRGIIYVVLFLFYEVFFDYIILFLLGLIIYNFVK